MTKGMGEGGHRTIGNRHGVREKDGYLREPQAVAAKMWVTSRSLGSVVSTS